MAIALSAVPRDKYLGRWNQDPGGFFWFFGFANHKRFFRRRRETKRDVVERDTTLA